MLRDIWINLFLLLFNTLKTHINPHLNLRFIIPIKAKTLAA